MTDQSHAAPSSFLACDDCGRPDICERLGECNLLVPPASTAASTSESPSLCAARDPACPRCGMTAQVEPSRSEPGRWMCHGCASRYERPAAQQEIAA